jgi:hypothetical protein
LRFFKTIDEKILSVDGNDTDIEVFYNRNVYGIDNTDKLLLTSEKCVSKIYDQNLQIYTDGEIKTWQDIIGKKLKK